MKYPPLWQQALSYPSQLDRYLLGALWPGGGANGGAVTAVADTMDLTISPGAIGVPLQPGQGTSLCCWDAPELVTVDPSPPSGTNRYDLIICQVRDPAVDGGPNGDFVLKTVAGGDAQGSAVVPQNAIALAEVGVAGGSANLNGMTIWDRRPGPLAVAPAPIPPDPLPPGLVGIEIAYGAAWCATDANSAFTVYHRAFPSPPWFRMCNPGGGMPLGMTCPATGAAWPNACQFLGINVNGGGVGGGNNLFVHFMVGYTAGTAMARPATGLVLPDGADLDRDAHLIPPGAPPFDELLPPGY